MRHVRYALWLIATSLAIVFLAVSSVFAVLSELVEDRAS